MANIFSLISQNWIGLVIGLVASVLLCLTLFFTVFKDHKILGSIVSVLLTLALCFGGMCIQNEFFTKSNTDSPYYDVLTDPKIDVVNPDDYMTIKGNGGYDRTYIEEQLKTAELTTDKYGSINMAEYKEIVIFYYDTKVNNENYTVNIIMQKIDDSIAFDGCINICVKKTGFWFFTNYEYLNEMYKGNNFAPLKNRLNTVDGPKYYMTCYEPATSVLSYYSDGLRRDSTMCKTAQVGNLGVYNDYFQQLGDLGILLNKNSIFKDMNNFYTSIYKSAKNSNSIAPCLDVTNLCAYYNNDVDEFYKCNLYLNVNYKNYSTKTAFATGTSKNKTHEEELKDDVDKIVVDCVVSSYVKFILSPKQAINMSSFDITKSPVKLTLSNDRYNYELLFDTSTELATGISKSIQYGDYNVKIESNVLEIGDTAEITVNKDTSVIKFEYNYEYNTILTNISLQQLSNLDLSEVDLQANPVTITLNNGTSSYNFIFDELSELSETITKRLPMGEYNYSIVSNELAFSSESGEITIDVNNHTFVFYYDYKTNIEYTLTSYESYSGQLAVMPEKLNLNFKLSSMPEELFYNTLVVVYDTFNGETSEYIFDNLQFNYQIDYSMDYAGEHTYQVILLFEDGRIVTNTHTTNISLIRYDYQAETRYYDNLTFVIEVAS